MNKKKKKGGLDTGGEGFVVLRGEGEEVLKRKMGAELKRSLRR